MNEAVEILKKFEKVNGAKIPEDVLDEFIVSLCLKKQIESCTYNIEIKNMH